MSGKNSSSDRIKLLLSPSDENRFFKSDGSAFNLKRMHKVMRSPPNFSNYKSHYVIFFSSSLKLFHYYFKI